ncbi:zinc finger CCHC domain-containing protein 7-like [Polymixia lowei]
MILGGEEQDGDRNIQLNLGYWSTSSSENDSGNEDQTTNSVDHLWAVSEKDKSGRDQPLPRYYCTPDRFLTCHNCNKTGHLAKSCPSPKRRLTCILCGIQGHLQKGCPGLHCRTCGLPSHYRRPCPEPPVWNQVCRRCGMTGHISDACPDTWRQYHLTTQLEAPLRPRIGHTFKPIRRSTQCYNCSERGHYGFECTKGRMVSGTFPTLPFVCQYDTKEDILKLHARTQAKAKELLSERHSCRSQKARGRDGKTWPEKRRERREMKKLRREAQARREGGLVGRSRAGSDNEGYPADPFEIPSHGHRHPTPPPQKKRRMNEEWGGVRNSSKKSREAERWKKRGGTKRGYLYPHGDLGAMDDNLLSPKHRVRHRRS